MAASADSEKKLLAVGEIGGEVSLLAMKKAPGTKNTNGVVITESKLKLADESAELEKAENKTESAGNTDDTRGSDYGNDLNVDERKTYLAERVVVTKDFSGDRQLMLNELLKKK